MPIYISLTKLTEQGAKNIKDAPRRIEETLKNVEAFGGKRIGFYKLMGEYDYLTIREFPSDEAAMIAQMNSLSKGNYKGLMFKAFTEKEFLEMVRKIP